MVGDWIKDVFVKKLGNGGSTRFWLDHWVGVAPLKEVFPRLYNISLQTGSTIQEMGEWVNDKWIWHIKWRRIFFTWEEELDRNLWNLIDVVVITKEPDSWSYANGGMYTVSANYLYLYKKFRPSSTLGLESIAVVAQVWGSWAPSKVIVFSWQALLGRLPTRANLAYRRILPSGVCAWCPWCEGIVEFENHLLVTCPLAWAVWSLVH
ncbi:putative ribonuclease H protein, partial [Trifolium medium]|nr:putative ribonuclease H protein [Trifolium medium]